MTGVMPTKWAVAQYWAGEPRGQEVFAPHLDIDEPCCFACGWFSERWTDGRSARRAWERARLERAHIVPAGLGGSNEADNLILLCAPCHEESPDWFNPWEMAIWISKRQERPSMELEQVNSWLEAFGEVWDFWPTLGELADKKDGSELVAATLRKAAGGAVVHGSGVGLRKSTMAAIARRAVAELKGAPHLPELPTTRAKAARRAGEVA